LEVRTLEPRVVAAEVIGRQILEFLESPRKETAADRAVGDESDAELPAGRKNFFFRIAAPKRVLGLQGGDRMSLVGPTDRRRGRLRQPQIADLPFADEPRHRADRVLDGNGPVHTMLIVEVDRIHAETLERRVARSTDVLGTSVDP